MFGIGQAVDDAVSGAQNAVDDATDAATDVGEDITDGVSDTVDTGLDAGAGLVGGLTGGSSGGGSSDNIDTPDYSTEVNDNREEDDRSQQDTGGTDRWRSRSELRTPSSNNNQATLSGLPTGALVIGGLLAVLFIMEVSN